MHGINRIIAGTEHRAAAGLTDKLWFTAFTADFV